MVLLGGLLVVVTWLAMTAVVVSLGLVLIRPTATWSVHHLVTSAWWGLAFITLLGYTLAFFVPVGSTAAVVVFAVVIIALGTFGWLGLRHRTPRPLRMRVHTAIFLIALAIASVYLALAVLGPVTHYDAGLYQWAAVQYATDYAVIPGVANLYGPLGYSSAEPLLGALLANTPWQAEGFRLLNGFFLVLLGLEALTRLISKPRAFGTGVALAGTALVYPPMIWMADFWVASPTPDVPVLVLAVTAAAYLADIAARQRSAGSGGSSALPTIVVLGALMVALRPTAAVLAVALIAAAVLVSLRNRYPIMSASLIFAALLAALLAAGVIARDRMLSGWLQYPLSVLAFDVPWRAPNPEGLRAATLGFARDPQDWQAAVSGWNWIGGWLTRLPQQWEPWWLLGALLAALVLLGLSDRRRWRPLVAVAAPFGLAAAGWFLVSPPALRFAWGPLFGMAAALVGWGLWRTRLVLPATAAVATGIAVVAAVAAVVRLDWSAPRESGNWLGIPYEVVPLPTPVTTEVITDSGIRLRVPLESDQCWSEFPLCTPNPSPSLSYIDDGIGSGFVS